jgi:hypothetical protein
MTYIPELDHIERRTWKRYAESGLTDILLGAILLASSVAAIVLRTDLPAPWPLVVYFVLAVPLLLISWRINQKVILPRQGRIRPGPSARSRRRKAMLVAFVSLGVTVLLVILTVGIRGHGFDGPPPEVDLAHGVAPIVMTASILSRHRRHTGRCGLHPGHGHSDPVPLVTQPPGTGHTGRTA